MDPHPHAGEDVGAKLPSLRTVFARTAEPYAGSDIALARRAAFAMWCLCSVVVVVLEIFYPPTSKFGDSGWICPEPGFWFRSTSSGRCRTGAGRWDTTSST